MTERAEDLQTEALRAFMLLDPARLLLRRFDWRGALILACGLGERGQALAIAAHISGAACLVIDPHPEIGRAAMRSGACDFVVNTVDEALRVLKNEIRQHRPISVGLTMDATAALEELLDRGVLPEMFTAFHSDAGTALPAPATMERATETFERLGTSVIDFDEWMQRFKVVGEAPPEVRRIPPEDELHLESFFFASAEELRTFDAKLLEMISEGDSRRRWIAAAPRFFHRERPYRRVVFLKPGEREQLR